MKTRELVKSGPRVSAIGLGGMGLRFALGSPIERQDAIRRIRAALERGVIFFDTAESHGPFTM